MYAHPNEEPTLIAWTRRRAGGHGLALLAFLTVLAPLAAGLAWGWAGLTAAVAASLALWAGPWPRLMRAAGRRLDAWLFAPDPPAPPRFNHDRPGRPRRRRDDAGLGAGLTPYQRTKRRYGERRAALLAAATAILPAGMALAALVDGLRDGHNDPYLLPLFVLFIGGYLVYALWQGIPIGYVDVDEEEERRRRRLDDEFTDATYSYLPYNIHHHWDYGDHGAPLKTPPAR